MIVGDLLLQMWNEAAADLGLEIQAPFELALQTGIRIEGRLLLKDYGAENGMIVVTDYSRVAESVDEIIAAGYGFSALSEPDRSDSYNRAGFIEMLQDWGWSGQEAARPAWLHNPK